MVAHAFFRIDFTGNLDLLPGDDANTTGRLDASDNGCCCANGSGTKDGNSEEAEEPDDSFLPSHVSSSDCKEKLDLVGSNGFLCRLVDGDEVERKIDDNNE